MTFRAELEAKVHELAIDLWGDIPDAYVVPSPEDLTFGNTGKRLNVCVLYADIHCSTQMVDDLSDTRAAEYYKAFLYCAAKIIRKNRGDITAYDGDRVMAVFTGTDQTDLAVGSALEIHYAVSHIINPQFTAIYNTYPRPIQHTIGIDCGRILAAKTGIRVDSDLVWVGPSANYAAKLNSFDGLDPNYPTRITQEVFARLSNQSLFGDDRSPMWDGPYTNLGSRRHYRSHFLRTFA